MIKKDEDEGCKDAAVSNFLFLHTASVLSIREHCYHTFCNH